MPEHEIKLSEEDEQLLKRVCAQLGFNDEKQAAEWLVKKRLARVAGQTNGRGRAMYMLPRPRNIQRGS